MMGRVLAIAFAVLADAVRRKVVWVVLLFGALLAFAIPALPSYGAGVVEAVYREVALALMYVALMVITLALAANRLPGEIERRTVYSILARGVRRWEYVVGTWFGIFITIGMVAAAFTAVSIAVAWLTYGEPMLVLLQGAIMIWFESGVVAALCMAVAAASGPVVVSVAALAFLFVGHARAGLLSPDSVAWRLYPSLDVFNIIAPVAHGDGVSLTYLILAKLAFIAWITALLLISSALFARRDL